MADATLNMLTDALALTFVVMVAANSIPASVAWLWAIEPRWNELERSITLAWHGLTW